MPKETGKRGGNLHPQMGHQIRVTLQLVQVAIDDHRAEKRRAKIDAIISRLDELGLLIQRASDMERRTK